MTTVFSAYVAACGQAWAHFDIYMPERWAQDLPRRAAGIPDDLELTTKPQLAIGQLRRLKAAGRPARWTAADAAGNREPCLLVISIDGHSDVEALTDSRAQPCVGAGHPGPPGRWS